MRLSINYNIQYRVNTCTAGATRTVYTIHSTQTQRHGHYTLQYHDEQGERQPTNVRRPYVGAATLIHVPWQRFGFCADMSWYKFYGCELNLPNITLTISKAKQPNFPYIRAFIWKERICKLI